MSLVIYSKHINNVCSIFIRLQEECNFIYGLVTQVDTNVLEVITIASLKRYKFHLNGKVINTETRLSNLSYGMYVIKLITVLSCGMTLLLSYISA